MPAVFHCFSRFRIQIIGLIPICIPAVDLFSLVVHIVGFSYHAVFRQLTIFIEEIFLPANGLPARHGPAGPGAEIIVIDSIMDPAGRHLTTGRIIIITVASVFYQSGHFL